MPYLTVQSKANVLCYDSTYMLVSVLSFATPSAAFHPAGSVGAPGAFPGAIGERGTFSGDRGRSGVGKSSLSHYHELSAQRSPLGVLMSLSMVSLTMRAALVNNITESASLEMNVRAHCSLQYRCATADSLPLFRFTLEFARQKHHGSYSASAKSGTTGIEGLGTRIRYCFR